MGSEPAVSIRLGFLAARKARAWALKAPHYRGEFAFGAPTVFAVYGDSVGCGLGMEAVDRTFAGVVAGRLAARFGPVLCRITAECGATASRLLEQPVVGDENFAAVSIGTNDMLTVSRRVRLERHLAELLSRLSHARRIVVLGPGDVAAGSVMPTLFRPLVRQRMLAYEDSILRTVTRFSNARHVGPSIFDPAIGPEDFAPDGFHPSDRAHRRIGEIVWDRLSDAL